MEPDGLIAPKRARLDRNPGAASTLKCPPPYRDRTTLWKPDDHVPIKHPNLPNVIGAQEMVIETPAGGWTE
jgi:hypothetical protein